MLSALVRRGLSGPAASALTRLQASAGLSTGSVVRHQAAQDPNDPPYVFKDHCRGKRAVSKEAEEVTERLRRNDFGAPKPPTTSSPRISQGSTRASASGSTAPTNASAPAPGSSTRGLQTSPAAAAPAAEGAASSGRSVDDASQELVEKGAKRLMQSDDGQEELRQGSFDLGHTTERVLEEGKKDAGPEAQAAAEDKEVKEGAQSRVVSMSQST